MDFMRCLEALALVDSYIEELEGTITYDRDKEFGFMSMQLPITAVLITLLLFGVQPVSGANDGFTTLIKIGTLVALCWLLYWNVKNYERIKTKIEKYHSATVNYRVKFAKLKRDIILRKLAINLKSINEMCQKIEAETVVMTITESYSSEGIKKSE